ncbi:GTPase-activating protein [Orbilia oligospora]|uniref:GTPase-activating protein GYP5 n=1 Tax=Orbilia oligospora TaxID=2813651 RepID=A0A6G1M7A1_ORBOL|nr:GTPase-activating protein [Orbilia oligospora]KAF3219491.1 GTPase-activating protein [Orbilia oligospora]KAF3224537.1 GTPase-activating protein [Orbilia oligospora]KAF3225698.1 GTPase-activating protein [Orbilia oligospora]KAF3248298.1 GTPase-activating protein [Orbilia oligospora]
MAAETAPLPSPAPEKPVVEPLKEIDLPEKPALSVKVTDKTTSEKSLDIDDSSSSASSDEDTTADSFHSPAASEPASPTEMKRELTPSVKSIVHDDDTSSTAPVLESSASSEISPKSSPIQAAVKDDPDRRPSNAISTTSMDDIDLAGEATVAVAAVAVAASTASIKSRSSVSSQSGPPKSTPTPPPTVVSKFSLPWGSSSSSSNPPPVPAKDTTTATITATAAAAAAATATPAPAPRRGPFSWLSRSSTSSVPSTTSPPGTTATTGFFSSRRNTTSSATTTASSITTPTQNGPSLPTLNAPTIQTFLAKPSGQDLTQQRMETTKDNLSHADANLQEEAVKGINSLRISFQKIKEGEEASIIDVPVGDQSEGTPSRPGTSGTGRETIGEEEIDWEFWSSVVEDYYAVAAKSSNLLTEKVQAGIPATIRGTVWQSIARSKTESIEAVYREFNALPGTHMTTIPIHRPPSMVPGDPTPPAPVDCKTVSQLEKEIKKDMGQRTSFANYKGFRQEGLMGLMKAYAIYDPEVGYVQGMAFLGAPLLLNMTEEEAFCILVELMRTYSLRDMFTPGMKGLHLRLYQYDRLLEDLCPALSVHLNRRKAQSSLYATQWFLTLFAYKFPLQLVLRVYDLAITEGIEGAVLKFGIALMKKNEAALRQIDNLEALLPFLREKLFDAYIDKNPSANSLKEAGFFGNGGEKEIYKANELVRDACDIVVTPEMLHKYTVDWVEMDRREMEEMLEKEALKNQNNILNAKVKQLSKEIESLTEEHVAVATDLVHKKMQNSQLLDENEGLKIEVDELKVVVDKQPKEVELKMKDEMEKVMKRNLEIHNENQSLEDQMREMEMELVGTKMSLAEITEAHELLKTRWNELRKALGD